MSAALTQRPKTAALTQRRPKTGLLLRGLGSLSHAPAPKDAHSRGGPDLPQAMQAALLQAAGRSLFLGAHLITHLLFPWTQGPTDTLHAESPSVQPTSSPRTRGLSFPGF